MTPTRTTAREVLGRRLRTQRLASAPLRTAADVVRHLGAVQAQERDQALWSLALRARGATYASVLAELDAGAFVRTHVLRPTWHYVPVEDVRWMLALTGPRIERALTARHRQLGLDDERATARQLDALATALSAGPRTRPEIGTALGSRSWPRPGERFGHLLMLAEVRGLVCSGPTREGAHTYALLDDVAPSTDPLDREEAVHRLARRFFLGHGPASVKDFVRWSGLTGAETTAALASLRGELAETEVDGVALWGDPDVPKATRAGGRALLLPTYDELTLTYPTLAFPVIEEHPMTDAPGPYMSDWWYGTVLHDGVSIGAWKPHWRKDSAAVLTRLSPHCDTEQRRLVATAVATVSDFLGREVEHVVEE